MVGNQNPEIIDLEDTACLAFRFRSGTLGTLQAGYLLAKGPGGVGPSYDRFLALRGTDGWATLDLTSRDGYTLLSAAPGRDAGGMRRRHFNVPQSNAYAGVAGQEFLSAFLTASRLGRPAPSPIEDAVHVLEVIDAALESSATDRGRPDRDASLSRHFPATFAPMRRAGQGAARGLPGRAPISLIVAR